MKPVIHTYTGRNINPLDVGHEDICIEDIAHALALINRFNGHTKKPISVAQHSVYTSRICSPENQLQALLHDAAEAYLGDVTKWLKHSPEMSEFRRIEDNLQQLIFIHFGCEPELHREVELADRIMVRYEGLRGHGKHFKIDHPDYPPLSEMEIELIGKWGHWGWKWSEEIFLDHFRMVKDYF